MPGAGRVKTASPAAALHGTGARPRGVEHPARLDEGTALSYAIERARLRSTLPSDAVQTAKRLINDTNREAINELLPVEFAEFARLLQTEETQANIQSMMAR